MKTNALQFGMGLMLLAALSSSVLAVEVAAVDFHGYISQGYLISTRNNYIEDSRRGTFDFREYGLNASFKPFDPLTLGGQVAGRDYGSVGNDTIHLDWLMADYSIVDAFGIRAGRLKVPYGLYNETRDIDSLRTEVLLPQGVYCEFIREYFNSMDGVAVYGNIPRGGLGGLSYQLQYGDLTMDPDDGDLHRYTTERKIITSDYDQKGNYAAALIWDTPIENLRLGVTGTYGKFDMQGTVKTPFGSFKNDIEVFHGSSCVLSAEYTIGDLILTTEYAGIRALTRNATYLPPPPFGPGTVFGKTAQDFDGYYLRGEYRVNSKLAAAAGYSYLLSSLDITGGNAPGLTESDQHDIFFSLRIDLTDNLILKVEEHLIDGTAGFLNVENPQGLKEFSTLTAVKLSFVF